MEQACVSSYAWRSYGEERVPSLDGAENLLSLGEVQSSDLPGDFNDAPEFFIFQSSYKLVRE